MIFSVKGSNVGQILPQEHSIEFATRFPDKIGDRKQLQRFLGCLNYLSPYYQDLAADLSIPFAFRIVSEKILKSLGARNTLKQCSA